jgi:2,4-dienoyl-CoA reductase-like NADH-dependent reductase (Old Yellow Enzyme family)/thioredoxin reductase
MNKQIVFTRLFEPINIGQMTVKNRIVMAPMGTGFTTRDGLVTERGLDYYEARARGGAGMVIVECSSVDFPRGIHNFNRSVIDNDSTLPGLSALSQVIKKHGARAIIQLNHAGRRAKSSITGFQPVAPSAIPFPGQTGQQFETPAELTIEEISKIVNLFAQAAVRARKAGFDGVELHSAHDYLLAQFLSPLSNQRRDQYGGSVENRTRILVEVLTAIRKFVGDDYPVWCRINGREYGVKNGLTLDDAKAVAKRINDMVNAVHVSAVGYGRRCHVTNPDKPGALLSLAAEIRKVVTVPVIAVGRLNPELGEKAIEKGQADMIALARELLADPEIPNKALSGRPEDIRPCIACFTCQDATGLARDYSITCAVNAALGRERECEIKPAAVSRKIAVIGGGPAGMEAARVLALRGHKVVLFEKDARLGGQMVIAAIPPHKERIKPLIAYFVNQLKKLDIDIRLNTAAGLEDINSLGPDAVILATGSRPSIPQLPGIGRSNVTTAVDILSGKAEAGARAVIIGGGSTGCETAEFLMEKGKEVTVVEMLPELAVDMGANERLRLMLRITRLPITFLTDVKCHAVRKEGVTIIDRNSQKQLIHADTVVLASGTKPDNPLFLPLRDKGFETHLAGDCWHPGKIGQAVSDGFRLGCIL